MPIPPVSQQSAHPGYGFKVPVEACRGGLIVDQCCWHEPVEDPIPRSPWLQGRRRASARTM